MPLELELLEATGALYPSDDNKGREEDPLLAGSVFFDINGRWHSPVLRIPIAAWLDMRGGKLRYRLSIGGLPGWMNFRMRIADAGPDYAGSAGFKGELQLAAWRNKPQNGDSSGLTLMLYSGALDNKLLERLLARSLGTKN